MIENYFRPIASTRCGRTATSGMSEETIDDSLCEFKVEQDDAEVFFVVDGDDDQKQCRLCLCARSLSTFFGVPQNRGNKNRLMVEQFMMIKNLSSKSRSREASNSCQEDSFAGHHTQNQSNFVLDDSILLKPGQMRVKINGGSLFQDLWVEKDFLCVARTSHRFFPDVDFVKLVSVVQVLRSTENMSIVLYFKGENGQIERILFEFRNKQHMEDLIQWAKKAPNCTTSRFG